MNRLLRIYGISTRNSFLDFQRYRNKGKEDREVMEENAEGNFSRNRWRIAGNRKEPKKLRTRKRFEGKVGETPVELSISSNWLGISCPGNSACLYD